MNWEAVEALDESFKDTKDMLTPLSLTLWTKIGIIAILTGGIGAPNFFTAPGGFSDFEEHENSSVNMDEMDNRSQMMTGMATQSESLSTVLLAILVFGLIGSIGVMMYITSVFEFIYYQSLLDKEVRILDYFGQNTGRGFGYFGFRLVFGIFMLAVLAGGVALAIVNPVFLIPLILIGIPFMLLVSAFTTLVHDFALVEMLKDDTNIIEAISDVTSEATERWKQFGLYIVVKFVLGAAYSIYSMTAALFSLLVLGVPFAILAVLLSSIASILVVPVIIAGLLAWLAVMVYIVMVPANTFIFYYALNVYERLLE